MVARVQIVRLGTKAVLDAKSFCQEVNGLLFSEKIDLFVIAVVQILTSHTDSNRCNSL